MRQLKNNKNIKGIKTPNDYTNIPDYIDRYEFEERAAIKEFEGNLIRYDAERQAWIELQNQYINKGRQCELFN